MNIGNEQIRAVSDPANRDELKVRSTDAQSLPSDDGYREASQSSDGSDSLGRAWSAFQEYTLGVPPVKRFLVLHRYVLPAYLPDFIMRYRSAKAVYVFGFDLTIGASSRT